MEESNIYNTSEERYNNNISFNNDDHVYIINWIGNVVEWIVICSGLPLTLVAIAAVYSLVGKDQATPVYIINLLVSDLVQLCCLAAWKARKTHDSIYFIYFFGVLASVGFMVVISLERYLMITQPLWYRFRRNIKTSVVFCVVVWILPLVYVLPLYFDADFEITETIFVIYFLLPFPMFIFSLLGAIKALSAARSVPADEKRRIVAVLVVVLLIYTLLFLPSIIWSLVEEARKNQIFHATSFILINISPLADLILYIFIRKGFIEKLLALCCSKISDNQEMSGMSASCSQTI